MDLASTGREGSFKSSPSWDACSMTDCFGEAIVSGLCFGHISDVDQDSYISGCVLRNLPIRLNGARVSPSACARISGVGSARDRAISAMATEFSGAVDIRRARLRKGTSFLGSRFEGPVRFEKVDFIVGVDMRFGLFFQSAAFMHCTFGDMVLFEGCNTHANTLQISNSAAIPGLKAHRFNGQITLQDIGAVDEIDLSELSGKGCTILNTTIGGPLTIDGSDCEMIWLRNVATETVHLGPASMKYGLVLQRSTFTRRVSMDVEGERLDLSQSDLQRGGTINMRRAQIDLSDMTVSEDTHLRGTEGAQVTHLIGADLAKMTFASLSLKRCELYGAFGLASLGLESTVALRQPPSWSIRGRQVAWRSRRRCTFDEALWRSRRRGPWGRAWAKDLKRDAPSSSDDEDASLAPTRDHSVRQIESVYRSLRQGLESRSDHAGASDLYYGEMEMRRLDKDSHWIERAILTGYWAVSGYGLRASRAFVGLLLALVLGALAFHEWGLVGKSPQWRESWLASAQALVPGISIGPKTTNAGGFIDIILTIVGPVLLGFGALALRGRTRR